MGIDLYDLELEYLSRQAVAMREVERRRLAAMLPRRSLREGAAGLLVAAAARLAPSLHITIQRCPRTTLEGLG